MSKGTVKWFNEGKVLVSLHLRMEEKIFSFIIRKLKVEASGQRSMTARK